MRFIGKKLRLTICTAAYSLYLIPTLCLAEESVSDRIVHDHLHRCFALSESADISGAGNAIEIVVSDKGRVLIKENHGRVSATAQIAKGDNVERMKELLQANPSKKNHCANFFYDLPIPKPMMAKAARLFEQARKLEKPLDLEESVGIHVPTTDLVVRLSNVSFSAIWFGCDPSPMAQWVQGFLRELDGGLDPCSEHTYDP